MNSDHYMQKLKAIREKYGCSPSNQTSYHPKLPYADKTIPESSHYDRKKIIDRTSELTYDGYKNNISIAASYHAPQPPTEMKYSRRTEKQIQQLRQNYRPRVTQHPRSYSRDLLERDRDIKSYYRQSEKMNVEESSPIKRVRDFNGRPRENSVEGYWKEREAKLAELSSNKLYQSRNSKLEQTKNSSLNRMQDYQRPNQGRSARSFIYESENRKVSDYTVANIDKIQHRIQEILNNDR